MEVFQTSILPQSGSRKQEVGSRGEKTCFSQLSYWAAAHTTVNGLSLAQIQCGCRHKHLHELFGTCEIKTANKWFCCVKAQSINTLNTRLLYKGEESSSVGSTGAYHVAYQLCLIYSRQQVCEAGPVSVLGHVRERASLCRDSLEGRVGVKSHWCLGSWQLPCFIHVFLVVSSAQHFSYGASMTHSPTSSYASLILKTQVLTPGFRSRRSSPDSKSHPNKLQTLNRPLLLLCSSVQNKLDLKCCQHR